MKKFLLVLTLFSVSAFAGFEKLTVENLDLEYVSPSGKGMVDRVGIGMSLVSQPYPIEINRTENSFELTSPYVDFSWIHPLKFIYDIEALTTKKTSAALGTKKHFVVSDYVMLKTKGNNIYKAEKLNGYCEGGTRGEFDVRLLDDCVKNMNVTIKRVEIPGNFFLVRVLEDLPTPPAQELDIPGDNLSIKVANGNYAFEMYVKYWFYAGLRAWGHVQFEDGHKILAIRVDQIKFGYIPVTGIVMKKLKEIIKSPDVTIDPPWIRIKTERLYENQ